MARTKRLYKVTAFSWQYGERKVHKERYVHAYSTQQAVFLAFRHTAVNEGWSINVEEVAE